MTPRAAADPVPAACGRSHPPFARHPGGLLDPLSTPTDLLSKARRIVIKIGSAQLIDRQTGRANMACFHAVARDVAVLRDRGAEVVLVSSGAVALGRPRLNLSAARALRLDEKQAAAAAGQIVMIQTWDQAFSDRGFHAAQALLSPADTENRRRWLNSRTTLETLLQLGAVPVVNENDTVATEELRYGDNDRMAARVAQLVSADLLVILSDVDGLYDADPATHPGARHIPVVDAITPEIAALAGPTRARGAGTGGMATKLAAAEMAMAAGCSTVITRGDSERPVSGLMAGARATWFRAAVSPAGAKRVWIAGSLAPSGRLHLDAGATRAVQAGRSLLAAGLTSVEGPFERGSAIRLVDPAGHAFATGLAGYDSQECRQIAGKQSEEIEAVLGYRRGAALVHADDLVLD